VGQGCSSTRPEETKETSKGKAMSEILSYALKPAESGWPTRATGAAFGKCKMRIYSIEASRG